MTVRRKPGLLLFDVLLPSYKTSGPVVRAPGAIMRRVSALAAMCFRSLQPRQQLQG